MQEQDGIIKLFIAVSPIGLHTEYDWGGLAQETPLRVREAREKQLLWETVGFQRKMKPELFYSFIPGVHDALTFEIDTDLESILSASVYRSSIKTRVFQHPAEPGTQQYRNLDPTKAVLPQWMEDRLLHVTGEPPNTDVAIERLMLLQHALAARFLTSLGAPSLYVDYVDGRSVYAPEPTSDSSTVKCSSPLWRTTDRIVSTQIYNVMRNKDVIPIGLLAPICKNLTDAYDLEHAA